MCLFSGTWILPKPFLELLYAPTNNDIHLNVFCVDDILLWHLCQPDLSPAVSGHLPIRCVVNLRHTRDTSREYVSHTQPPTGLIANANPMTTTQPETTWLWWIQRSVLLKGILWGTKRNLWGTKGILWVTVWQSRKCSFNQIRNLDCSSPLVDWLLCLLWRHADVSMYV